MSEVDAEWESLRAEESGIWRRPGARHPFTNTEAERALPALQSGIRWALLLAFWLGAAALVLGTLFSLTEQLLELGRTASNGAWRAP